MRGKGGEIDINQDRCKGCGYCIVGCPSSCITEGSELNPSGYIAVHFSNPANCTGCAACAVMCPEVAIEVWRYKS